MAKGNHKTKYYVCANMNHDSGCYDAEFKKHDLHPILHGSRFNGDFSHLEPPSLPGCIVEIHRLGPDTVNVGIYTNDLGAVPGDLEVGMTFRHVGDAYFERVS